MRRLDSPLTEVEVFAVVSLVALLAQAPPDSIQALELGELYRIARNVSPRVGAARASADAATARVAAARLPPDPQLQLGFMNYTLPQLAPMSTLGMTQLQVMQMLPVAGQLGLAGRAASADAVAAHHRARAVEWEVRGRVAMLFYDLYAADQGLHVTGQTLRLLQDIRATAEAMYRVGQGKQADVLRAQVEIARMSEDTIRMTTMRATMAARLNALLDRPADAEVRSPVLPAFPDSLVVMETMLAMAGDAPMVQSAEREAAAAATRQTLARRDIWPDVVIGLQYAQRAGEMGAERMGSLMLGASIPAFASGRQLKMRDEAAAMRRMADAELAEMRARLRGEVTAAWAALTRARNLAALYRTTIVPQAEAAAAAAMAAYRVGSVDFMTLLDDRMTVNKYRQELFTLESEQGKAWAELEMLLGRELFDAGRTR